MGPQSCENPNCGNYRTPAWESHDKMSFGCGPMERCREYYMGEGVGFPQVWAVVSLVSPRLPVACISTKSVQTMH